MFNSQWSCAELCLIVFHVRSVKGLMQLDTSRRLSPSLATRSLVQSVNLEKERIQTSWKLYCQYLSVINHQLLSVVQGGLRNRVCGCCPSCEDSRTRCRNYFVILMRCSSTLSGSGAEKWARDSIITLTAALLFCWNSAQQQFWWPNTTAIATVMLWTRHVNVVKPFRTKLWRLR